MKTAKTIKDGYKLGHVYDITDYFKSAPISDGTNYAKYYIANDVWCFHIYRILVGFNSEYEAEPRTKLIEQYDITKRDALEASEKAFGMTIFYSDIREFPNMTFGNETTDEWFKVVTKAVVDLDGFENDDVQEFRYDTPIEKLIEQIDGGYGITILDENLNVKKGDK